jgi:hypothetical protein
MQNLIHITSVLIGIVLWSFIVGCSQSAATRDITISERPISEVNWQNVKEDFSDTHFRERKITLTAGSIKILGIRPCLYQRFQDTFREIEIVIFLDEFNNHKYLYVIDYEEKRYVTEVLSNAPVSGPSDLPTFDDIIAALRAGAWSKPIEAQNLDKTFVEAAFFDEVTEKNIKLPDAFLKLGVWRTDMKSVNKGAKKEPSPLPSIE